MAGTQVCSVQLGYGFDLQLIFMMENGRSVALTALERHNYSSTVNIIITNNTSHFLDARKEWVRGGEGVVRPVRHFNFKLLSTKIMYVAVVLVARWRLLGP